MKNFQEAAFLTMIAVLPVAAAADTADSGTTSAIATAAGSASTDAPAFVAGRPGNTESPLAVPKGYFQVESQLASYTYDKTDGIRTETWSLAQTALRYGIADATDVQLVISPYAWQHQTDAGTVKGFGNTTLRLLHTLAGADGSSPAFGLIGFITLPTASQELKDGGMFADRTEGGIIATGSTTLTDKASITLTLGEAARHPSSAYISDIEGGINLTYTVTDTLGVYAELFADRVAFSTTQTTIDLGTTYLLDNTTQLDAGVNIGANHDTPDANIFVGWSHRF